MATPESSFPALCPVEPTMSGQSRVRVLPLSTTANAQWDKFVFAHPDGTLFHLTSWMRVMEKTYGYRPHYFYAERDGEITGIAPSFLVSSWLSGRCLISLPFAVYGGVCAVDSESGSALITHLERFASEQQVEYLELRNRSGEIRAGYHANTRYATFTLPLIPDTDKLYASLPKDVRYMVRKAEKAGLRIRRGFDQLDSFYTLMTVNLRRLGTPAFPRALFQNLIDEFRDQVDLTLVYSEEKPVAGGLSFFFRDWMQPYYIGSLEEAKALAANDFLWWKLVQHAAETGRSTFDFGRSKKASGNFDFKKKWNPRIESLSYQVRLVRRKEMPDFSPANPKFELAASIWKKIPLGLTRAIGPRVVRWFP
jgi:FemAB-related protein (PEP-CTERM system-associated)